MKKLFYPLLFLLFLSQTGFSQNVVWGAWSPVSCWKGLHFHLSREDYDPSTKKHVWRCQFKNDYDQPISFEFSILSPEEVSSYQAGTWSPSSLGSNGRMTLTAGEDQSADPKDYFGVQPGTSALFTSGTKLFVAIKNVRFGNDDQSLPYATNECGQLTGTNNNAPVTDGGDAAGNNKKDAKDVKPNDAGQPVNAAAKPAQPVIAQPAISADTNSNITNTAGLNATSQQTQADINKAQNPDNDAIMGALYLDNAKVNAMKPGGATAAQLQQIQQVQQQQKVRNDEQIAQGITQLVNSISDIIAEKQEVADRMAYQAQVEDQYRIRDLLYSDIAGYSYWFMDTTILMQTPISPWDDDQRDKLIISKNVYLGQMKEYANENNGESLDSLILKDEYDMHYPESITNPFNDKMPGNYNEYLGTIFIDTRSKQEKKNNNVNTLGYILYGLTVDYYANNAQSFSNDFDNYLKITDNSFPKIITQWLYQANADLLYNSGKSTRDKTQLLTALKSLFNAGNICTVDDYSASGDHTGYDLSRYYHPESYYSNLLAIRKGELTILMELCTFKNTDDDRVALNNEIISIYKQTKNDLAVMFSDPLLSGTPKIITDYTKVNNDDDEKSKIKADSAQAISNGISYYNAGRYHEAITYFEQAGMLGNPDAVNNLGMCYWMLKDSVHAVECFQAAADKGYASSIISLANIYRDGGTGIQKNIQKAIGLLNQEIAKGDKYAINELGDIYFKGNGVPVEYTTALRLYTQAAQDGDALGNIPCVAAMESIAIMYETGTGVLKNKTMAISWYQKTISEYTRESKGIWYLAADGTSHGESINNPDLLNRVLAKIKILQGNTVAFVHKKKHN